MSDENGIKSTILGMSDNLQKVSSEQLNERDIGSTIGQGISPPYPPEQLASLIEINGTLDTAIRKKARREVGFGFEIVTHQHVDEPDESQKQTLLDFYRDPTTIYKVGPAGTPASSINEVFEKCREDYHHIGWLAMEVIYAGYDTEPAGLSHIPASTIRIKREKDAKDEEKKAGYGFVQEVDGQTKYFSEIGGRHSNDITTEEKYVDEETGEVYNETTPTKTPANEILFIPNPHPNSLYYGIPDYISQINTIVADQQARKFNSDFFENDAIPQFLFLVKGGKLSEEEREDLRGIITQLRESEGRRAAVIEAEEIANTNYASDDIEIEIKQLTQMGDEDMSFIEFRERNELEITKTLEVPPQLIGRMESANKSNSRSAIRDFTQTVIQPEQNKFAGRIYSTLHQKVLGVNDYTIDFHTKGADNKQKDTEIARKRIGDSYTINEARKELGLSKLERGDLGDRLIGEAFNPDLIFEPSNDSTDENTDQNTDE